MAEIRLPYTAEQILKLLDRSWVEKFYAIQGTSLAYPKTEDLIYSLEDYLPKDEFDYEILVRGSIFITKGSSSYGVLAISSELSKDYTWICGESNNSTSLSPRADGTVLIPVGKSRQLIVRKDDSDSAHLTFRLWVESYRPIGLSK